MVIPGKISTDKCEWMVPLEHNTAKLWEAAITNKYSDAVIDDIEEDDEGERRGSVSERRRIRSMTTLQTNAQTNIERRNSEVPRKNSAINVQASVWSLGIPSEEDLAKLNNMYRDTLKKEYEAIANEKPGAERMRSNSKTIKVLKFENSYCLKFSSF